jgi:heme-degrading monooxygenase HmoA
MKPRLLSRGDKRADSDDGRCIPRAPDTGRVGEDYQHWFTRMTELARNMPGYVSHKAYVADDGERLTLFEWESATTLQAWATHPEHVAVKELGRQKFYSEYRAQVYELVRESKFRA